MDPIDLNEEYWRLYHQLDEDYEDMLEAGKNWAKLRSDYDVAAADKALRLRDGGYAVSLVQILVKGDKDIAKIARAMRCAEVLHEALQELINIHKLQLRCIEKIIEAENR